MEGLITLVHTHLHFVNWQLQQRILGLIVFWVKEVLDEYIKGDWRVAIRYVEFVSCYALRNKQNFPPNWSSNSLNGNYNNDWHLVLTT